MLGIWKNVDRDWEWETDTFCETEIWIVLYSILLIEGQKSKNIDFLINPRWIVVFYAYQLDS